jgi:hypothetical protein
MRTPRRAYARDGTEIPPMDVTNMRENRVRSVGATCEACRHEAVVNCDALPADLLVPDMALRHKCSACGSKQVVTWPNWTERPRP